MKSWLKGGLIVLGLDFLFWLILFISATQSSGDMAGLAAAVSLVYGGLSLIPAFIVGAIIGGISGWIYKTEKRFFTWSAKASFFSSLIIYIVFFLYAAIYHPVPKDADFIRALQYPGWQPYALGIAIIIAVTWLFWVIGGIVRKGIK